MKGGIYLDTSKLKSVLNIPESEINIVLMEVADKWSG